MRHGTGGPLLAIVALPMAVDFCEFEHFRAGAGEYMDNLILMSTFEKFPTSNTQKLVNSNSLVIPLAEMSRTVYHKSILPLPFCTLHVYLEKTIAKSCRYW